MASYKITNPNQIEGILGKIVEQQLVKFAEQVKLALKQELKSKFYGRVGYGQNSSGTDWYTRTWELLECISVSPVKKNGNEYSIKVFYDTDKMSTYPSENGEWSKHESIITGTDSRLMIPFWIEYGQNSPLYSWEGFEIVGDLKDRLIDDRALLQHFEKELKKLFGSGSVRIG